MIDNWLRIMHPKNLMALEQIIEQIWTKFTSATCRELVESMARRLERCVLVFGGSMNKY